VTAPAVSVIIPTRNRAAFLEAAVASVRQQTFRDWELIVVDDGSRDGTGEVVRRLSDRRVRALRFEASRGAAAARNAGLSRATGAFVAFLDDDDEWLPSKLERQIGLFLRSSPEVGLVYGSYPVVDRKSGQQLRRKVAEERGDLSRGLLRRNFVGGMSSVVVRREGLDRVGGFDETLATFEDYDLFIRLSRHYLFDFIAEDVLKYYVHSSDNQLSRNPETFGLGLAAMARKYSDSPTLRRNLSVYQRNLGIRYCSDGDFGKGRRAIRRAIRFYPFDRRHYPTFVLSLLGATAFRAVTRARRRVLAGPRRARPVADGEGGGPGA